MDEEFFQPKSYDRCYDAQVKRDEEKVTTRNAGTGMTRRQVIEVRIRELEAEKARYARFPEQEQWPDGTVIRFSRTFRNRSFTGDSKTYNYVALKVADDRWYITGSNFIAGSDNRALPATYDALIDLMADSDDVKIALAWGAPDVAEFFGDTVEITADELSDLTTAAVAFMVHQASERAKTEDESEVTVESDKQ